MKIAGYVTALGALALAGCGSSGSGSNVFSGETLGVGLTVLVDEDGELAPEASEQVSASVEVRQSGDTSRITVAFEGGGLDGRTIVFEDDGEVEDPSFADAISGLEEGETGDLVALFDEDKASFAGLVIVSDADYDNEPYPNPGGQGHFHAFYGANPLQAGGASPLEPLETTEAEFGGTFVGAGTSAGGDGHLIGDVGVTVGLGSGGPVTGTITGLDYVEGGSFGHNVGFEATLADDRSGYSSTNVSIDGDAASGQVSGGFYGAGATETAGAISAVNDHGAIIGGFQADRTQ